MPKQTATASITLTWNERHKFWDIRMELHEGPRQNRVVLARARTTAALDQDSMHLLTSVMKIEMESWIF